MEPSDAEGSGPGNPPPGQASSRAMCSANWFSLFRKGVDFLAELSCMCTERKKVSGAGDAFSGDRPQALPYMSWTGRNKKPHGRVLAVKQAKAASRSKLYGRVRKGQDVPRYISETDKRISRLGEVLSNIFFPHRCQVGTQAMAAFKWPREAKHWQTMEWYGPMLGHLHLAGVQCQNNAPQGPHFRQLQSKMPWWQANCSNPAVLELISHGVQAAYPLPSKL